MYFGVGSVGTDMVKGDEKIRERKCTRDRDLKQITSSTNMI